MSKRLIASSKVELTSGRLVHCIAQCCDCSWNERDYMEAARKATLHVCQTGHTVRVDQEIVSLVRVKKGRAP